MLRLSISLVVFATATLPPSAAAQVAAVAFQPRASFFAPPPLAELEAHGRELRLHLAGRKPARVEFISGRVNELNRRLAAGLPASEEPPMSVRSSSVGGPCWIGFSAAPLRPFSLAPRPSPGR